MAQIAGLLSENVKRLKLVEYKFDKGGGLLLISGENDQGKSSFLESIIMLFGGAGTIPKVPINKKHDTAYIIGELTDVKGFEDLVVTRTFTDKGSYLKITNVEGSATYSSPQAILDKLIGKFAFDPLSFINDKDQVGTLLSLGTFKINPKEIDAKIQLLFDDRTYYNRESRKYKGLLEDMPEPEADLPDKPISISELNEQKNEVLRINGLNENKRKALVDHEATLEGAQLAFTNLEERKVELQMEIDKIDNQIDDVNSKIDSIKKSMILNKQAVAKLVDGSTEDIDNMIYEAEKINEKISTRENYLKIENYRDTAYAKADEKTTAIEALKKTKADTIAKAQLPVKDLSYDENGVTYQGLPFDQASDSDKLKISFNIAKALNPELKLIISKDGDKMGMKKLKELMKMSKEEKYLFLVERIHDDGLPAIIIEDGMIKK